MVKSNAIHFEIRCQETLKKVPPKSNHRTDNSLTLHDISFFLSVTCTYLEHLWIVLQLQSLNMIPMRKHMAEWH